MKIFNLLFFILLLILFESCFNRQVSNQNYAVNYNKSVSHLHPEYLANNIDDIKTRIFVKLRSSEILYSKNFETDVMQSNLKLSYKLYNNMESNLLLDTGSIKITDTFANENERREDIIKTFEIKTPQNQNCYLELLLTDLNRNEEVKNFIDISKERKNARQNFLVFSSETFTPLFRNYLLNNENVTITHEDANAKKLFVRYYKRDFPIAFPPFSVATIPPFKYAADSLFELNCNEKGNFNFSAKYPGFYHFQVDTLNKEGMTLFKFKGNFPQCNTAEQMILPLRYLTSKQEFDIMLKSENKKLALDEFWLNLTGSNDRARELIKEFYNRVQNANKYFTSYNEGWKTDRGMVYLIYGQPNNIYKNGNSETWIYGEENNYRSIQFSFVKVNNPFTENDYSLTRNPIFKDNWYLAVDTWRQGRVFNNN